MNMQTINALKQGNASGHMFMNMNYSAQEVRSMMLLQDTTLPKDHWKQKAAEKLNISYDSVTKEQRLWAKRMFFFEAYAPSSSPNIKEPQQWKI